MEIAVIHGGNLEAVYLAFSLAHGVRTGLAPVSAAGDQLIQKVTLVRHHGGAPSEQPLPQRIGAPGLHGASVLGCDDVVISEDIKSSVERAKLIVLSGQGVSLKRAADTVVQTATPGSLVVCFGAPLEARLEMKEMFKNSKAVLLSACATWSVNQVGNALVQTSHGTILCERMARGGTDVTLHLQALEGSHLSITYKDSKYYENWAFGSLLWHLFDTYAALLDDDASDKNTAPGRSLYELMCSNVQHRLVYAKLLTEGLCALTRDELLRADSSGSPFGLGVYSCVLFLRLPSLLIKLFLPLVILLTGNLASTLREGRHGSYHALALAESRNGWIVRMTQAANIEAPLNKLLVLRSTTPQKRGFTVEELRAVELPKTLGLIPSLALVLFGVLFIVFIPLLLYGIVQVALW